MDPHHPLCGQRLQLLSLTCARGPAFIAVALPDGRRRLLRRAATDLDQPAAPIPSVAVLRISARTLVPLARRIRNMLAASIREVAHADAPIPDPASDTTPD